MEHTLLELTTIADPITQTTSVTAQVYDRARADILTGVLEPGQKLKIDELRQVYGSGSSPIREALSLLTSDGLVERVDQRGFRVALVSAEAFDELLTTRCWLEERALTESIERGGKDWEERVVLAEYHLSRTERSISKNAFVANQDWERRHKDFHMALISASGSSILLNFCNQLYDQKVRYRHVAGKVAYPKRNITKEHQAIMQAALDRDAEGAVAGLVKHYRATGAFLAKGLASSAANVST
ncbi:MAG: GntR family transcriptional regulator [Geminicoccaceae bacterium]